MKKAQQDLDGSKFISIVVPAFRAEKFIQKSLMDVIRVMDLTRYRYEIICVDDGNLDKTRLNAEKIAKKLPWKVKVVGYVKNLGKGHAVRFGMAKSHGNIIGFLDAGNDLDPNGLPLLLEHFSWYKADAIIGSKRHPASKVSYPWQRRIVSLGYQIIVRILFGLNIKDTQVGMKFFKREVLEKILPRILVKEFAFDIEMLSVANYLGFKKIYEAPVEYRGILSGSTVISKGFFRTISLTFWDTLAVFYRLKIRNYYDTKNRKNWVTPEYLTLGNNR